MTTNEHRTEHPAHREPHTPGRNDQAHDDKACCGPGYASPEEAMRAERETILYVSAGYVGTGIQQPDYLATIDVDPTSPTYSRVISRTPMPQVGDELHHFGWNACSSCHGDETKSRRFLVMPGFRSGRINIVDTSHERAPTVHKVIEPQEIAARTNLSAPHTVHCLADGQVMIAMLGDGQGNAPGGFLLLDGRFEIAGRWEHDATGMQFNHDFWYQPRHNVMVSSEFAAPKSFLPGFNAEDAAAGKYGRHLHFWDWQAHTLTQTIDLGEAGLIPFEVRFQHHPDSPHGYVGTVLGSSLWHLRRAEGAEGAGGRWAAEQVVAIPPVEVDGWPFPVPAPITDLLISMDDRYLYLSNWLHGDIRQYDIADPAHPRLVGQVWCGGVLGRPENAVTVQGHALRGGPHMLQLSLDGKRLYTTNSLLSTWDNQFYPELARSGSYLLQIDCAPETGGLKINDRFYVDFGQEPSGPARAHEMRYPGGDCTSDIWL
jgi:selenium-binding protein 1